MWPLLFHVETSSKNSMAIPGEHELGSWPVSSDLSLLVCSKEAQGCEPSWRILEKGILKFGESTARPVTMTRRSVNGENEITYNLLARFVFVP